MFQESISCFFILSFLVFSIQATSSCTHFNLHVNKATYFFEKVRLTDRYLENKGFVLTSADIEFEKSRQSVCKSSNYWQNGSGRSANILTNTAKIFANKNQDFLKTFQDKSSCYLKPVELPTTHPKYRSLDGYGNNLKNPYWGVAGTPFERFTPKNYEDSVYSIKKSVTGKPLPNARKLVTDVLKKAQVYPRTSNEPNAMLNYFVLMLTHDMAFQVQTEAIDNCKDIRCCSSGNHNVLHPNLQNSACMHIEIPENDPFYQSADVKCLNMVRAEIASSPAKIQYGEILNKVTGFMDLSIIYGSNVAESNEIRSFSNGKLNLGPKNTLPVDKFGKYTGISSRFTSVIQSAIWPVIFARNHNNLCDSLKEINPNWSDEILFQEARRINIALVQSNTLGGNVIETVFRKKVNETYNKNYNPQTYIEFSTSAYRFLHYFLTNVTKLETQDKTVTEIPLSDTFKRLDLIEDRFDDILRGELNNRANMFTEYSDQVISKFFKNSKGIGLDIIAIDIQRGRDHGIASFLNTRRKCGLAANFTTFDDLITIFPQSYIDLLKNAYESVEDIDLYVGGSLESFLILEQIFVGETFGCIIGENYRNVMGGDAYFYSHADNPYPFTKEQLKVIKGFSLIHLICSNSGLTEIQKIFSIVENTTFNTKVPCSLLPKLNVTAWKE